MSYQPPFDGNWLAGNASWTSWYTPPSVQNAVRFMYAGAAIAAITPVLNVLTIGSFNSALTQALPTAPVANELQEFDLIAIGSFVISGLINVCLWLWMARKNRAGRRWAQIVATVFFAVDSLGLLGVAALPLSGLGKVAQALSWIVGLCAIVLLWRRDSRAFFSAQPPRY